MLCSNIFRKKECIRTNSISSGVTWWTNNNATIEDTAAQFECSTSAVSQAEKWYRDNRLHNLEAYERLKECRAEKRKQLRWLERKMRAIEKHYRDGESKAGEDITLAASHKKKKPVPMSTVALFSREWNKIHTEIAELDGLINRVLNVTSPDGKSLTFTLSMGKDADDG